MRLIDADALKRDICKYCNDVYSDEPCEPSDCEHMRIIDNQPTIDAVEVLRCKDCKYFMSEICHFDMGLNWSRGDDFCSYGERRRE